MTAMQTTGRLLIGLIICVLGTAGCGLNMKNQERVDTFEASPFFSHNLSARPLPPHTIPHEPPVDQPGFYSGRTANDELVATVPQTVTTELIERGQTQYEVYCTPCHGQTGQGDGIIVQHGFPPPPSFHLDRLRQAPAGHFFEVITHGVGDMYSYGQRVPPEDRWAIIAYIRELQSSQAAVATDNDQEAQDATNE